MSTAKNGKKEKAGLSDRVFYGVLFVLTLIFAPFTYYALVINQYGVKN